MSSEKAWTKIWDAAIQAALAAVAFTPKLVSNLAVNVGVMIKAVALFHFGRGAFFLRWMGCGRTTPRVNCCFRGVVSVRGASVASVGAGRTTPPGKTCFGGTSVPPHETHLPADFQQSDQPVR